MSENYRYVNNKNEKFPEDAAHVVIGEAKMANPFDFNPKYEPVRNGDIKNSVADISKAEKAFGYVNEHDFDKELKETIDFYEKEFNS